MTYYSVVTVPALVRLTNKRFGYYRYLYLKIAWQLKTYIDTNSSIDFEKLH